MSSPLAIDRHESHFPHGTVTGPSPDWQFSALARMRAMEVLPVPRSSAEKICVGDPPRFDGVFQRLRNMFLPDDFVERLRAISAGQERYKPWQISIGGYIRIKHAAQGRRSVAVYPATLLC